MSIKFTYAKSWEIETLDGIKINMISSVFNTGIYNIITPGNIQSSRAPSGMVKEQKRVEQLLVEGSIKSLKLGFSITVHKVDGFWIEYVDNDLEPDKSFKTDITIMFNSNTLTAKAKLAFTMWGLQFYIHNSMLSSGIITRGYTVSELSTGKQVWESFGAQKECIEATKVKLESEGKNKVLKLINDNKL